MAAAGVAWREFVPATSRAQQHALSYVKRVLYVACGVIGRNIQQFKVIAVPFNFGSSKDRVSHLPKDVQHLAYCFKSGC
jgi:hypothetical protein